MEAVDPLLTRSFKEAGLPSRDRLRETILLPDRCCEESLREPLGDMGTSSSGVFVSYLFQHDV